MHARCRLDLAFGSGDHTSCRSAELPPSVASRGRRGADPFARSGRRRGAYPDIPMRPAGPRQANLRRMNGGSAEQHQRHTATKPEGEAAPPAPPWSMTHRPAVWLPAGGVGGDRPRRPAQAGPNRGCNPLPHKPEHRKNPLPRRGGVYHASTVAGRPGARAPGRQPYLPPIRAKGSRHAVSQRTADNAMTRVVR